MSTKITIDVNDAQLIKETSNRTLGQKHFIKAHAIENPQCKSYKLNGVNKF